MKAKEAIELSKGAARLLKETFAEYGNESDYDVAFAMGYDSALTTVRSIMRNSEDIPEDNPEKAIANTVVLAFRIQERIMGMFGGSDEG